MGRLLWSVLAVVLLLCRQVIGAPHEASNVAQSAERTAHLAASAAKKAITAQHAVETLIEKAEQLMRAMNKFYGLGCGSCTQDNTLFQQKYNAAWMELLPLMDDPMRPSPWQKAQTAAKMAAKDALSVAETLKLEAKTTETSIQDADTEIKRKLQEAEGEIVLVIRRAQLRLAFIVAAAVSVAVALGILGCKSCCRRRQNPIQQPPPPPAVPPTPSPVANKATKSVDTENKSADQASSAATAGAQHASSDDSPPPYDDASSMMRNFAHSLHQRRSAAQNAD